MKKDHSEYRFASVAFVNAALWTYRMREVCPEARVLYDAPAQLTEKLLSGEADAALIPVVDLFANPSLQMVDDIGLCADGNVTSVLLKCFRPLREVKSVAADRASHTSNMLAEILLARHFHVDAAVRQFENQDAADAAVVIGDQALCSQPAPFGDYDLAGEWKSMTGLPFVFAVWACRKDSENAKEMSAVLRESLRRGMEKCGEAALVHSERTGIPLDQCRNYIEHIINYQLGQREVESMQLFKNMIDTRKVVS